MAKTIFFNFREKFKYKYNKGIRFRWTNLISPLVNHPAYDDVKRLVINLGFTGLVISFIVWSLSIAQPLRKGYGIAVILALAQYYLKWYFALDRRR
jgi:hypothetical protein